MIKIINNFLSFMKLLLLVVSFIMTFYIIMSLYQELGKSFMEAIPIFIPYLILFFLLAFNHILKQKQVTGNVFYNTACCLVFSVLIFVMYRVMFDEFMLSKSGSSTGMSFQYFSDMIAPLKSMFYLLIAGNICFMLTGDKEKSTEG